MAYWYDGAALAATRSPVIALFWCLIKFTTTTTTTISTAAFRGPPMIPARCLTSFNRFQLPSYEATPRLLQPHQGNMSRSWLRDTDSQNGDALLCIYYINDRLYVNKQTMCYSIKVR